jgi:hypothetical protein
VERFVSGRRDFTVDPTISYKKATLPDLVSSPTTYKGADVEFEGLFYRKDETIWNHFYTPFTNDNYTSFSVWPLDARVWTLEGRLTAVPTLYMRKNNSYLHDLMETRAYSRVVVTGRVLVDYENRPWIEVHRCAVTQPDIFTTDSLRILVGGLTDAAEKRPATAKEKLEQAIEMPLSPEARYVAHMTLGRLYEESNDFVQAANNYDRAEDVRPGDRAAMEGGDRNRKLEERRRQIEDGKEPEDKAPGGQFGSSETMPGGTDWRRRAETAESESAMLRQKVSALEKEIAALKSAPSTGGDSEAVKKLTAERDQLKKDLDAANAERTSLTAERDQLKKDLETASKSGDEAKAAMAKDLEAARAKQAETEKALEDAKKAASDGAAREMELKNQVSKLETERDELKKKVESGGDTAAVKAEYEKRIKVKDDLILSLREEIRKLTEDK